MPTATTIPELYLVEIKVDDWERAVRWYAEVLGLRLVLSDQANRFALLEAGPGRIALKHGAPSARRDNVRLTFRVDDLEGERARLLAQGLNVGEPAENAAEGYREIRLTDPEGTPITFFQWRADPPTSTQSSRSSQAG